MKAPLALNSILVGSYILLGSIFLTPAEARAADVQSLTNFTKNDPTYSDGKLMSCALQFSTIFTDRSLQGRAFFAEGSLGFVFFNGEAMFAPFTKVAVSERLVQDGKISASPLPIYNTVINGDNGINSSMFESANLPSPINPDAALSKYRMNDKTGKSSFIELATSDTISVAFSMLENNKRYEIPVDLTLAQVVNGKEVHSNEAVLGFTTCVLEMTKLAKRNNGN